MDRDSLWELNLTLGDYQTFVDNIIELGRERRSAYVCVANVHMCVEVCRDPDFAKIVNDAHIITPDGKPLSFALKWLYGIEQERVAGMDLMPSLLREAENNGVKVFFYGSTEEILSKIKLICSEKYPLLNIAGSISPPFRTITDVENKKDIIAINDSGAGLVLVALGCPKQEVWMEDRKGSIQAVMVGVGGAFPVFSGMQKRAPKWMQEHSLEWFYRLIQDPRHLFKRYFVTNSIFITMLLREKLKLSLYKK